MHYIFSVLSILFLTAPISPNLPEGFSIQSLESIENRCPTFQRYSSDAVLLMECDGNRRNLRLAKSLSFDGVSYMKDPDIHAKEILSEIQRITHEDLSIKSRIILFCNSAVDALGRCKAVYILTGPRDFDEAALAITPKDDKINSFSYFLTVSWERGSAGAPTAP